MSHQDQDGRRSSQAEELVQALSWLIRPQALAEICFRQDCTWTPWGFVSAALIWAWSNEDTLGERFQAARRIVQHIDDVQHELATSYQAFLKMLMRWTAALIALVVRELRWRMQSTLSDRWELHGFAMFGIDGSRVEVPRTRSHEAAFSGRKKKRRKGKRRGRRCRQSQAARARKANVPQMWLTTVWHAGTGLPWDWRSGPADSSERAHWLEMLSSLPPNSLCTVDAGFVGYHYLKTVLESGHHVLLRVGSNVRLLRKLGHVQERNGFVYLWPDKAAEQGLPPIKLRLVVAHNGRHPVYLLTSVLDEQRLSDQQVIELYARRWGIELFYRNFKQTFGRRKLRSTSADHARLEFEWSVVALWALALYAQTQSAKDDVPAQKVSIALALRAIRRNLRDYLHPRDPKNSLNARLRRAKIDDYERGNKSSRNYPRKKQEQAAGPPKLLTATAAQRQHAQAVGQLTAPKGLTA